MRGHLRPKYIIFVIMPLLTFFIMILIMTAEILGPLLLYYSYAQNASPSFARQEVNDEIHDVKQFSGIGKNNDNNNNNSRQKISDYNKNPLSASVDIQRISYSSDKNFLNATLWVGGSGVKENPSLYGASIVAYGMVIDADNNEKTGKAGFDYQLEIQWSNGTWHKTILEWSSDNSYRILNIDQNYSDFFRNNQNYVLLSLDLDTIVSPRNYKLMFYSTVLYGKSNFIYDLSSLLIFRLLNMIY
jgi:hypothetical protein